MFCISDHSEILQGENGMNDVSTLITCNEHVISTDFVIDTYVYTGLNHAQRTIIAVCCMVSA